MCTTSVSTYLLSSVCFKWHMCIVKRHTYLWGADKQSNTNTVFFLNTKVGRLQWFWTQREEHWNVHYMKKTRGNRLFQCECLSLAISSLPLNLNWGLCWTWNNVGMIKARVLASNVVVVQAATATHSVHMCTIFINWQKYTSCWYWKLVLRCSPYLSFSSTFLAVKRVMWCSPCYLLHKLVKVHFLLYKTASWCSSPLFSS